MPSDTEIIDIQPKNILLGVLDNSAFARFERDELQDPMPRKKLPSHTVYVSRPMPLTKGALLLCDFSEARFDDPQNVDRVMPDVYRAPEVVLGMPWSYPIDVWGFAMTVSIILKV
jgi:serine/threonine-protein kinase SRPK3